MMLSLKYHSREIKNSNRNTKSINQVYSDLGSVLELVNEISKLDVKRKKKDDVNSEPCELYILSELADEFYLVKEGKKSYQCRIRNLLHIFQGMLEVRNIDICPIINDITKILDAKMDSVSWSVIDNYLLEMYRLAFLLDKERKLDS